MQRSLIDQLSLCKGPSLFLGSMLELLEDILDACVDADLQCRWVTLGLLDGEDKCVASRFCLLSRSCNTLLDEALLLFFVDRLPLLKLGLMLCDAVCLHRHMGERQPKLSPSIR
ncbi:hypothetical protein V7S43_013132 [Phytophthora oleae]|uniref:Uncharacterized protein n=1 Tax=Phytophthora oleae TaxID=2107226 RepID=A0ABD3F551_9STRA